MARVDDDVTSSILDYYCIDYNPNLDQQSILCPVHDEDNPSCSLNLDKGLFHCWSCGAKGNMINLIMEMGGIELRAIGFVESAQLYQVRVQTEVVEKARHVSLGQPRRDGISSYRPGAHEGNSGRFQDRSHG